MVKYKLLLLGFLGIIILILVWQLRASRFEMQVTRSIIVFHTSPLIVLSLPQNANDKALLLTLADTVYAEVPDGYGPYRLSAVWDLAALEKNAEIFPRALTDLLGVGITGWVGKKDPVKLADQDESILFSDFKSHFALMDLVSGEMLTNLSLFERFDLAYRLARVSGTDVRILQSHNNQRLFADSKLADGTPIKTINYSAFDAFLESKLQDSDIRSDALSVEVINTTDASGVGNKFARFVSTIGGKVIKTSSDHKEIENCQLLFKKEHNQKKLVLYLEKQFGCLGEINSDESGADLIVLVGTAFAKRWKK